MGDGIIVGWMKLCNCWVSSLPMLTNKGFGNLRGIPHLNWIWMILPEDECLILGILRYAVPTNISSFLT